MATHPAMIEYFPITPKEGLTETMLPGGAILLFNTEDVKVKEHIMKWAAVCALVQDCIAPPGSNVIAPATVFGRHHKRSMAVVTDMIKLS